MINLKKNLKTFVISAVVLLSIIAINHVSPNYFLVSRDYIDYGWDFYVKVDNFQDLYCNYLKTTNSSKLFSNYKESIHNKKDRINANYNCHGYSVSNQEACNYSKQNGSNYETGYRYKPGWYTEGYCYKLYKLF